MIEGQYVNCVGTHIMIPLQDADIDSVERRVEAQGFEYDRNDSVISLRAAVVNGLVYRDIDASPSAKFGDSRELNIQITPSGILGHASTVFSPVILQDDLAAVLDQLAMDTESGATAYRLEFTDDSPAFEKYPDALRRIGVTVEDVTDESFVCRIDEYRFQVFSDGLAYPAHAPEDDSEDIEQFVNVLNEALKQIA